jgi:Ca2+-binding EF-hand superfamily protein
MSFEEKAEILFNKYDCDKSGNLDKAEIQMLLNEIISNIPENELCSMCDKAFSKFDTNLDGTLQIEEFKELLKFIMSTEGLTIYF